MATRDLSASMLAAIAAGTVRHAILYEGEFVSSGATEYVRLWTGYGTLSWDSKSWTGSGNLLGISAIDESGDLTAKGFVVSLSGIALTEVARALAGGEKNRPGKLWLGLFDSSWSVISDPYLIARGRFDRISLEDAGKGATISALYESVLIDLERARERRYTPIDQARDYAGDRGFQAVASMANLTFQWGR